MSDDTKMYYSISEVAGMLSLEPYVLRFWEREFPQLKPKKNRAGNRIYQQKEIDLLMQIKFLLYEKGFTIEGARNHLKNGIQEDKSADRTEMAMALLGEIRKELDEILKMLS